MKRREFLGFLAGLPVVFSLRGMEAWAEVLRAGEGKTASGAGLLILIELKGGNDGLNTLVPYRDPVYRQLRPRLALESQDLLPLNESKALHAKLAGVKQLFERGDLALIQGVGYPEPNLSHFRSIDIWETASSSQQFLDLGWASPYLAKLTEPKHLTGGLILGDANLGPIRGTPSPHLVVQNSARARERLQGREAPGGAELSAGAGAPESLRHIEGVQELLLDGLAKLGRTRPDNPIRKLPKPEGRGKLTQSTRELLEMMGDGHTAPLMKLSLSGFDTHAGQLATQSRLLADLDGALVMLAQGLRTLGLWERTLVMTYSEFGRRAEENRNLGTDHGTANVHFVMGGGVRGGRIFGAAPSLSQLDQGNLRYTSDFREVYAAVVRQWWRLPLEGSLRGVTESSLSFLKG